MNYQFGTLSIILFFAATVSLFVAILSWRRREKRPGLALAILQSAVFIWAFSGAFEAAATTVALKTLWSQISYLGIVSTPLIFLTFALSFGQYDSFLTKRNVVLSSLIPLLTLVIVMTNNLHQWHWTSVTILAEGNQGYYRYGVWFWVHTAYSYILILSGVVLIILTARRLPTLFRTQSRIIIAGAILPLAGNIIYVFDLNPVPGLDWTPIIFGFSGLLMSIGIFRYGILRVVPLARDVLVEKMDDGLLVMDINDIVIDINPAMSRIIGFLPGEMIGRHVSEVFTKWEAVLDYLQESTGEPAVVTRGTGEQVEHYDLKITGLVKPDGSNIGRLLVCRNESEKIAAQIKLFESQERFKSLSDAATEAIFISEKGVCLEQNLTAEKMFGFTLDEAVGRMGTEWIVPEHRDQVLENMLSGFEDPYQVTALRKDGSTFEAEIQARMYRYKGRDVRVTALRDITELKEAEAKLRKNLAEKETLLQEIHHRVKNNLQLVVSLLRLQISELADETSINALVDTVNRIHSMAFIHEQLYRSEDFSNIQFNWYIESVLRELTQFHRSGSRIRIDKDLIELNLDIKIAIPCGLILNEAVTNALKHGFPEQRKGLIKVVLEPYQDDRHCLKVSDDGKGLPEGMDPASASTLGMRLMHLLAEQIGGTLSVTRRKGTTVSIIF